MEKKHAIVTEFSEKHWDTIVELSTFYVMTPAQVVHNVVKMFLEVGFPRTRAGKATSENK